MDFDDVVLLSSYLHLLAPSLKVCCSCLYADGASFSQLCDCCSFPLKARRHTDFFPVPISYKYTKMPVIVNKLIFIIQLYLTIMVVNCYIV